MSGATDQLQEQFDTVERSSWRWECQGEYQVDADSLQRWRDGLPFQETEAGRAWHAYIRGLRGRGIPFERVRMLTEPLTDYLRWMLDITYRNIDAGEDIRWLDQGVAQTLAMPPYDFYIFDDQRLAIMHFDGDKVLADLDVTDDPQRVATHRAYRDAVWPLAVRHADYIDTFERSP
jgi:hypothetical protein